MPRSTPRADPALLSTLALLVGLWALCSGGVHGFALGRHSDDWAYTLADPSGHGLAGVTPFVRYGYFFRPLFFLTVYGVNTLGGAGAWPAHLLTGLAHLGAGLGQLRVLRRLHVPIGPAGLAAGAFLALPMHYEAVLWSASLGLTAGMACAVATLLLALRFIEAPSVPRPLSGRATLGWCAALAGMAFVTACWHEQPAAAACAGPALMLAGRPGFQRWGVTVRRAALAGLSLGAGCAAYMALLVKTTPAGARGSAASLAGLASVPGRMARVLEGSWDLSFGARGMERLAGAQALGWEELRSAWGWAWMIGLGVLAAAWVAWAWWMPRPPRVRETPMPRGRALALIGAGAGVAVLGLAPVALIQGTFVFPRYLYPASFGLAMALGAAVSMLVPPWGSRWSAAPARVFAGVVGAAVLLLGAAPAMVGWGAAYRARDAMDRRIVASLRPQVPDPPRDAVFVVIDPRDASATGRGFDAAIPGNLHLPWGAAPLVARLYGRADLSATHWRPGGRSPVASTPAGVDHPRGLRDVWARPHPERTLTPWDRVVLFTVDERGGARVLGREDAEARLRGAER